MKVLQEHERKNGYDYHLVDRNEYCAIYEQKDTENDIVVAFEVFKIKTRKETKIKDRIIEGGEVFPGNEDFGQNAWSIGTFVSESLKKRDEKSYNNKIEVSRQKAYNKYDNLTKELQNGVEQENK